MKISFLLQNAYGIGGTVRATFNSAGALAERHDVEIVSVWRTHDRPCLPLGGKVRLRPLIDRREDASRNDLGSALLGTPSALVPAAEAHGAGFDGLTDRRVARFLARTDADVVVATRPGLVIYLAAFGRRHYLRVGQEHRVYGTHEPGIRAAQDAAIAALDAHTTLTEADAATHRRHLAATGTPIVALPNASPRPPLTTAPDGEAPLVIAGGRLIPVKRYRLLVEAFATVAAAHPRWKLRIYGRGHRHAALRARIDELGLSDHVFLMGANPSLATEWAKGAIAAVTSREESFGMTIVEAMRCGTPVVATDCPHGPAEIIRDGEDGLLVRSGDRDAVARGLLRLIEDADLRRAMGSAARRNAERYAPEHIARRYEELFDELNATSPPAPVPLDRRVVAGAWRARATTGRTLRRAVLGVRRWRTRGPGPLRPKAACSVNAAGDLVVRLERAGMPGEAFTLTATLRGSDGPGGELIEVPLGRPETDDAPWTAVLERRALPLAEGRWDFHVVRADDGARRRVASSAVEQQGLLGLEPVPGAPFSWWIPYATVKNNLSVRAWRRPAHAEAAALTVDATSCTVEGALYGARFVPGQRARLLAVPRRDPSAAFETDVTALGAGRFRFRLAYSRVLEVCGGGEAETVDLVLRLSEGAEAVRVARVIGDVVDRKRTDVYPAAELPGPRDGATASVRPRFTAANDLSLVVRAAPGAGYAGRSPGSPASVTNDAAVLMGAPGVVTEETVLKSARAD
ncbi:MULTISPECIES: glycosyltransferase family 4 protein [Streptomyces]|uniref:glycosyltransferase family 4 protein n=1 Tax=Streptomyces TaxID=1883 RepID=UPI001E57B1FB|nr:MULTISPECIES: glycosyltransferase family 4 protein [Streptomyces]UFQ15301.1 glycosyltransferase family 4 protein [Streptomyces huasconensis]WCL84906.1 glycosyltransferase family 4 protein [Streptomyces sp. JCM 35825]